MSGRGPLLIAFVIGCCMPSIACAVAGLELSASATMAYAWSANDIAPGRRSYTLQPSVNDKVGLMQGDVGIRYKDRILQATVVGQQGWFVDANYSGDDAAYRMLQQAWLSVDVASRISIRAGIMPSHLGYESINERENLVLSRLLCSDATPYYETGAAIVWKPTDVLTVEGLALNGWQRIVATNDDIAWGTRIVWAPDSTLQLNWGTFYGNMADRNLFWQPDAPNANPGWRFYSNVWAEWKPTPSLTLVGIADVGQQQYAARTTATTWCLATIAAYRPHRHWRLAARIEHFSDPKSAIVPTPDAIGFTTSSVSANVDWNLEQHIMLRAEIRTLWSDDRIFPSAGGLATSDTFATISASYTLR